jgi:citrate lyase subunit beta/citryl-CoA lyase
LKNRAGRVLPLWRSLLFVPATSEKFVETAHTRGADAIILDLEDGVAPARKQQARDSLAAAIPKVGRDGTDVLVRVNRPWRLAFRDIEAAVSPGVAGLILPKVGNAQHVRVVAEMVAELESERAMDVGHTAFVVLVETADAFPRMEEIANADPRIVAMTLGSEDFSASCGMVPDADSLYVPKMHMLIHARAAGLIPLGFIGTIADYKDLEGLRRAAERARRLGFMATTCIHPAQVPIANEAYGPTAEEVDLARRIVAAAARAESEGQGALQLDGKMIDAPIVVRARALLDAYERFAARARVPQREGAQ